VGEVSVITFEYIRSNKRIQVLFEMMLIDPNTPGKVYQDLFGVNMEFVNSYKEEFNGFWHLPRIFLYEELLRIVDEEIKDIAIRIFNGGWEALDALFNRGTNINAGETAMKIIKISAAKAIHDVVIGKNIDMNLIAAARSLINATSTYTTIDESVTGEDWEVMIREIQDKESKDQIDSRTIDALEQVKPKEIKIIDAHLDITKLSPEELIEYEALYINKIKEIQIKQKAITTDIVDSEGED